jgi:hypothetical protein
MRQIESKMVAAIKANKNAVIGSTYVNPVVSYVQVFLHSNLIARVHHDAIEITLAGYPTVTTRSRLNALLSGLCDNPYKVIQRNGVCAIVRTNSLTHLLDADEWITVSRT